MFSLAVFQSPGMVDHLSASIVIIMVHISHCLAKGNETDAVCLNEMGLIYMNETETVLSNETKSVFIDERVTKPPEEGPDLRPRGIFTSLESILEYLKLPKYRSLPTIKEMLKKYRRSLYIGRQIKEFMPGPRYRFIVIEGLYTSKRSAVAMMVSRMVHGRHIRNPFGKLANVSRLPATFDTRRAYYCLTKYGVANRVPKLIVDKPVVMERYWLDQSTFALAKTFKSNLPPLDSGFYDWPRDLLKPDIMFFINADNKSTQTQNLPNEINNFTINLLSVYERYRQRLGFIEVSSNQEVWDIAKEVVRHVRELGPDKIEEKQKRKPKHFPD